MKKRNALITNIFAKDDGSLGLEIIVPQDLGSNLLAFAIGGVIQYALEHGVSLADIQRVVDITPTSQGTRSIPKPKIIHQPAVKDSN